MIITNKIQCKHCKDIIESKHTHDFKLCSCGKCAVDGGKNYLKRSADSHDDFIELSETKKIVDEFCPHCETEVELENIFKTQICPNCKKIILPCSICKDMNCSDCSLETKKIKEK